MRTDTTFGHLCLGALITASGLAYASDLRNEVRSDVATESEGQPSVFTVASAVYSATVGPLEREARTSPNGVRPVETRVRLAPVGPVWPKGFEIPEPVKPEPPISGMDLQKEIQSATNIAEHR